MFNKITRWFYKVFYKDYMELQRQHKKTCNDNTELLSNNSVLENDLQNLKKELLTLQSKQYTSAIVYNIQKEEFDFIYEEDKKDLILSNIVAYIIMAQPQLQDAIMYWAEVKMPSEDYTKLVELYEDSSKIMSSPLIHPMQAWGKIIGKN